MPTLPRLRPRNRVAMPPLLRKGGVHERSKSGLRAEAKQQLQEELGDWQEALEEECITATSRSRIDSGNISNDVF